MSTGYKKDRAKYHRRVFETVLAHAARYRSGSGAGICSRLYSITFSAFPSITSSPMGYIWHKAGWFLSSYVFSVFNGCLGDDGYGDDACMGMGLMSSRLVRNAAISWTKTSDFANIISWGFHTYLESLFHGIANKYHHRPDPARYFRIVLCKVLMSTPFFIQHNLPLANLPSFEVFKSLDAASSEVLLSVSFALSAMDFCCERCPDS